MKLYSIIVVLVYKDRNFGECYFDKGTNVVLVAEAIGEMIVMSGLIYYDFSIKKLLRGKEKIGFMEAALNGKKTN